MVLGGAGDGHEGRDQGSENSRGADVDDQAAETVEGAQAPGEATHGHGVDQVLGDSGYDEKDGRDGETLPHVAEDGGEVGRDGVGPPVPGGGRHQHAEQDRARRPERRDVMRREFDRKAVFGAHLADESHEQEFERQADGRLARHHYLSSPVWNFSLHAGQMPCENSASECAAT
jgi:hypothetical protein